MVCKTRIHARPSPHGRAKRAMFAQGQTADSPLHNYTLPRITIPHPRIHIRRCGTPGTSRRQELRDAKDFATQSAQGGHPPLTPTPPPHQQKKRPQKNFAQIFGRQNIDTRGSKAPPQTPHHASTCPHEGSRAAGKRRPIGANRPGSPQNRMTAPPGHDRPRGHPPPPPTHKIAPSAPQGPTGPLVSESAVRT